VRYAMLARCFMWYMICLWYFVMCFFDVYDVFVILYDVYMMCLCSASVIATKIRVSIQEYKKEYQEKHAEDKRRRMQLDNHTFLKEEVCFMFFWCFCDVFYDVFDVYMMCFWCFYGVFYDEFDRPRGRV